EEYRAYFEEREIPFFVISALAGHGLTPMLHALSDILEAAKENEREEEEENLHDDADDVVETWDPLA
ncbi:MAG TPA: hypothetical protein DCE42_06695, partial [Myxococcales bacterium]|nr:hypothetical protein [Myxococcales bacterium]